MSLGFYFRNAFPEVFSSISLKMVRSNEDEAALIQKMAELHDKLTDAVALINETFSVQVIY